jgi:A/G-specific adenine glycosylase
MQRRDAKDIWQGLYDFFIIETKKALSHGALISKSPFSKSPVEVSEKVKHILSHQHLYIQFVEVTLPTKKEADELTKESPLKWYSTKEVQELPKPIVINRFLEKSGFFDHH